MADLTAAPFTLLLDALRGAGVRATMTPGEVSTPGAWVTLDELRRRTVSGADLLVCSVYLIVGDRDELRALDALGDLLNKARTALTPDGPVVPVRVVLPHGPTPLPALRVPVHLTND